MSPCAWTAREDVNNQENVEVKTRGRGAQAIQANQKEGGGGGTSWERRRVGGKETRKQHLDHMHQQQQREHRRLLGASWIKGVRVFNMLTQKLAKSQSKQASHTRQGSPFLPLIPDLCHAPKHIFSHSLIACSLARFPPTGCQALSSSVWNTRLTMSSIVGQAQGGNFKK